METPIIQIIMLFEQISWPSENSNYMSSTVYIKISIGCAMGTKCAPSYANIFMGNIFMGKF